MIKRASFGFLIFAVAIVNYGQIKTALPIKNETETPLKVSVCQLKNNPPAYNHKLIEVTGFISHGFEDFALFDPACTSNQGIWLEYGGTTASGTIYCCGVSADRSRPKQPVIEDIPISLVNDEMFRTFDKLIWRPPDSIVHATIAGRFFSGKKSEYPQENLWEGYGHFGCCSLFVIEKVVSVDPQDRDDLDYRASPDQPDDNKYKGFETLGLGESGIEVQKKADLDQTKWLFDDRQKVATDALARILKIDESAVKGIRQTNQAQGRYIYQWKNNLKGEYMIVVSRPYMLLFFAKDPKKIVWIVIGAYKILSQNELENFVLDLKSPPLPKPSP